MEPPTVREVIARLRADGFAYVGCCGDHRKFRKGCRVVILPGGLGEHLHVGTWRSVRRQAGWR